MSGTRSSHPELVLLDPEIEQTIGRIKISSLNSQQSTPESSTPIPRSRFEVELQTTSKNLRKTRTIDTTSIIVANLGDNNNQ